MKQWIFICYICDKIDNVIMKRSFSKKWKAEKWAYKKITKHKKDDEWYYDIIQVSEET